MKQISCKHKTVSPHLYLIPFFLILFVGCNKNDGVKVLKVAFLLPFGASKETYDMLKNLYSNLYAKDLYSDLWFMWKGKPLIMAYPQSISNDESALNDKLKEFFTYRPGQPDYVNGPNPNYEQWGWLEIYPQHKYLPKADGSCEEVTVGVAQNASPQTGGHCCVFNIPNTYGRSYTNKNGWDSRNEAFLYGLNFQEQWDRALEIDPDFIFVTGWNEWIAGKWDSGWQGYNYLINYIPPILGKGRIVVSKGNDWEWELSDEYDIYVEKNKMEIKASRTSFNVIDKNLNFESPLKTLFFKLLKN